MIKSRVVIGSFLLGATAVASTPPAASLMVRVTTEHKTFHVGEEIPLTLEFRGVADKDYYFSTEKYDRSGRVSTEEYSVSPVEGTADPLSDALGELNGGLRGVHPLDDTPFELNVSLNDWIRFSKPGKYTLVVASHRLHRYSAGPVDVLRSGPLELEITAPDQDWAARDIVEALRLIDEGSQEDITHGGALLRYLGTVEAAHAIVERYSEIARANAWSAQAAVLSSPQREAIIKEMEARVDAGDALDPNFIPTLACVALLAESKGRFLDESDRRTRLEALRNAYDKRWHAALAIRPTTPAILAAELARIVGAGSDGNRRQIGDDVAAHPAEASAAFLLLPPDVQRGLLEFHWTYVNRMWMVPALERVYAGWHGDYRFPGVGDVALRRLLELQPEIGRPLVIDEMKTGTHGIGYDTLARLPDAELADLDDALRERARRQGLNPPWLTENNRDLSDWLIARYGSAALLPFVRQRFDDRACGIAAAQLVFLLKHDAETSAHALTTCALIPFATIAPRYWDPRLEAAAVARSNSPDRAQATEATRALDLRARNKSVR